MTVPRIPESDIKTLDPLPRMVTFANEFLLWFDNDFFSCSRPSVLTSDDCARKKTLSAPLFFKTSINSSVVWVIMKVSAGPPILMVVYGARGWFWKTSMSNYIVIKVNLIKKTYRKIIY